LKAVRLGPMSDFQGSREQADHASIGSSGLRNEHLAPCGGSGYA
jgi:hypothetical protein